MLRGFFGNWGSLVLFNYELVGLVLLIVCMCVYKYIEFVKILFLELILKSWNCMSGFG